MMRRLRLEILWGLNPFELLRRKKCADDEAIATQLSPNKRLGKEDRRKTFADDEVIATKVLVYHSPHVIVGISPPTMRRLKRFPMSRVPEVSRNLVGRSAPTMRRLRHWKRH